MMRSAPLALFGAALWLAACQQAGVPEAPGRADLSMDLVRLTKPGPPPGPEGACWASDVTPMVIETVTEQVMISDARKDPQGQTILPAVFRSETRQKIVQEREEIWFRSPCPAEMTVDFIASLQRALKARGLYLLPLTGEMDTATRAALRRFQADRGLESDRLALTSARELGLVTTDLGKR
ncbi:MAG: peptidoglycan-binding domain-containing protein [Pseudotabrizicola sp.]|uniref:peptidoglycan-binding domain-containing protein n=1 Tax=Pseudotabrizicola sp. TaxID=2939647 RepID=UPI0027268772|nr:peptidoglycan-binding domain-containing protein [Pseudotabrizicola sp.]MDO8881716.1 peptidoglycan-binding domain-containing protein [Pseudotabrizicola sp.]MDP2080411.1 peptidoglycan-binding domain-containing protein [Pseudotabrizicola sp.]MDZ7573745.1 peptidoglycan-binding domain-containing protein [Pseudotabrizicola sp.]